MGEIEDEYHFFLRCPAYADLRADILPRYLYTCPSKYIFIEYMKSETESNIHIIVKYLKEALKVRSSKMQR